MQFTIGGRYNWKHQPERLIYMGPALQGDGVWHQFSLVDKPGTVWCEVRKSDLDSFEVTMGAVVKLTTAQDSYDYTYPEMGKQPAQWKQELSRGFRNKNK